MRPDRVGLWTLWRAESLFSGNGNPSQGMMVGYDLVGGIAMVAAQGQAGVPHRSTLVPSTARPMKEGVVEGLVAIRLV